MMKQRRYDPSLRRLGLALLAYVPLTAAVVVVCRSALGWDHAATQWAALVMLFVTEPFALLWIFVVVPVEKQPR